MLKLEGKYRKTPPVRNRVPETSPRTKDANQDSPEKQVKASKAVPGNELIQPDPSVIQDQSQINAQRTSADYDEDLYIIDPQTHFHKLKQLEQDVLQRSEYFRTKREYSLSSIVCPIDNDGAFLEDLGLRASMQRRIRWSGMIPKTLQGNCSSFSWFWQILKSYSIMINVSRSVRQMVNLRFCTDAINILVAHERVDVIELRKIPLEMIANFERDLESVVDEILGPDLAEHSVALKMTHFAMMACRPLFNQAGSKITTVGPSNLWKSLHFVRAVVLLLDVGVISYVRSHGSAFDKSYFGRDLKQLNVSQGADMGFRCYWAKLACLHSFLDRKKVWVFDFSARPFDQSSMRRKIAKSDSHSLLARMEDVADIWGPVYNVRTDTGFIKYYGVSKGVICKEPKQQSTITGATPCHYYSRRSFLKKRAAKSGLGLEDSVLSPGDLLLIGAGFAGFHVNNDCRYPMSAYAKESAAIMTVLGTKESVWKLDSRGLAVGLSKYLGVTVTGTQKLIPRTTYPQRTHSEQMDDRTKSMQSRDTQSTSRSGDQPLYG
ncbi:MAG: hypothetical protein Q9226_007996 [Calogaya cf. arnoldii]